MEDTNKDINKEELPLKEDNTGGESIIVDVEVKVELPTEVEEPEETTSTSNMDFVLSTEDVNAYDLIISNKGLDITDFATANAPALFNHNSDKLIGKWINVRKEDNKTLASLDFDNDTFSQDTKNKVIKGSLKGVSIGIDFKPEDLEFRDDNVVVVKKSVLKEASLTPLPANKNAKKLSKGVVLYSKGIKLNTESLEDIIKIKKQAMELELSKKVEELSTSNTLVLAENETLKLELSTKETNYNELKLSFDTLQASYEALKNEVDTLKEKEKEDFINSAILEGKITESNKDEFIKLSKENFELCKNIVNKLQKKAIKLSDEIVVPTDNKPLVKKYEDYSRVELSKLAKENATLYKEVEQEYINRTTKK